MSKNFDLGLGSYFWYESGFGKFPLEIPIFSIFSLGVKKISSFWVKKYLGQRWVGLLFTAGQKHAWVGSGPVFRFLPRCRKGTVLVNIPQPWSCDLAEDWGWLVWIPALTSGNLWLLIAGYKCAPRSLECFEPLPGFSFSVVSSLVVFNLHVLKGDKRIFITTCVMFHCEGLYQQKGGLIYFSWWGFHFPHAFSIQLLTALTTFNFDLTIAEKYFHVKGYRAMNNGLWLAVLLSFITLSIKLSLKSD